MLSLLAQHIHEILVTLPTTIISPATSLSLWLPRQRIKPPQTVEDLLLALPVVPGLLLRISGRLSIHGLLILLPGLPVGLLSLGQSSV